MKKILALLIALLLPLAAAAQISVNGDHVSISSQSNGDLSAIVPGTGDYKVYTNGSLRFGVDEAGIPFITTGTLAAAGSTVANAAPIVAAITTVTGADATKGVVLPDTPTIGALYIVINTANAVLKVWPDAAATIGAIASNANMSIAAYTTTYCIATSLTQWYCVEPAVAA